MKKPNVYAIAYRYSSDQSQHDSTVTLYAEASGTTKERALALFYRTHSDPENIEVIKCEKKY